MRKQYIYFRKQYSLNLKTWTEKTQHPYVSFFQSIANALNKYTNQMKRQLNAVQKDLIVSHRAQLTTQCPCPSGASFSSALKFCCIFLSHHTCSRAAVLLVGRRANL